MAPGRRSTRLWRFVRITLCLVVVAAGCDWRGGAGNAGPRRQGPILEQTFIESAFTGHLVILWGGRPPGAFDPVADRWLTVPKPPVPFLAVTTGAWTGKALVLVAASGRRLRAVAWQPGTSEWQAMPNVAFGDGKKSFSVVAMSNGVLVSADSPVGPAVALDLAHRRWDKAPVLPAVVGGPPLAVGDQIVEFDRFANPPRAAIVDPRTGGVRWSGPAPFGESPFGSVAVGGGGRMFVWAGEPQGPGGTDSRLESLDVASGVWELLPPSPLPARGLGQVLWTGRYLLVVSGSLARSAAVSIGGGPPSDVPPLPQAAIWDLIGGAWHREQLPVASAGWATAVALLRDSGPNGSLPAPAAHPLAIASPDVPPYLPVPVVAPLCQAKDLTAVTKAGSRGATGGGSTDFIDVTNHGAAACRLEGVPALELVTASGTVLPVKVDASPDIGRGLDSISNVPQGVVTLLPGEQDAAFLEQTSSTEERMSCRPYVAAPGALLELPTGTVTVTPSSSRADDEYAPRLNACGGTAFISPWRQQNWTS